MIPAYKILRGSAWLLLLTALVTIFSGFAMTKSFLLSKLGMSYDFSRFLHVVIIPLIFVPLFYVHSLTGFLNLIKRHKILNRNFLKIGFIILWTAITAAFLWFYFAKNPFGASGGSPIQNTSAASGAAAGGDIALTADEVGKHNSSADCWIIIDGSVYNVTAYLPVHPGGAGAIVSYCGKDGSQAFATKNQGRPHSSMAKNILDSFFLGKVGETIAGQKIQDVQNQNITNVGGEDKAELED